MTLGTKLYNLRNKKGISLEKLALELNISKSAIGKWEADKSKPSVENLLKLCDNYETDFYELLEDVSNVNFSNAKFKGHSYAGYAENFTVNNTTPPELIESIVENQNKITVLVALQNELLVSLLSKNQ
jgi:transcriptional regulator with XRE-family HTH domain